MLIYFDILHKYPVSIAWPVYCKNDKTFLARKQTTTYHQPPSLKTQDQHLPSNQKIYKLSIHLTKNDFKKTPDPPTTRFEESL